MPRSARAFAACSTPSTGRSAPIAAELGVHHDAVSHAIESDRFVSAGSLVRPTLLDPYKGLVGEILKEYPRLLATRIFGMLREPRLHRVGGPAAALCQDRAAGARRGVPPAPDPARRAGPGRLGPLRQGRQLPPPRGAGRQAAAPPRAQGVTVVDGRRPSDTGPSAAGARLIGLAETPPTAGPRSGSGSAGR
jgi:hypothetical protein